MTSKTMMTDNDWDDFLSKGKGKSSSSTKYKPRCYESHPAYEVAPGMFIYGGSCSYPIVKDADVYGGFDWGMHRQAEQYPWEPEKKSGPVEFLFKITDMQAPSNPAEFKKMIEWLAEQLKAGKKVHIGCIGGHGRTGMVLAALHKYMTGDDDAIVHVRKHYCKKVVETSTQINFLEKNWGIKPVKPSKDWSSGKSSQSQLKLVGGGKYHYDDYSVGKKSTGQPLKTKGSVWGE